MYAFLTFCFWFCQMLHHANVSQMRFQALMPDILHWLGIKKIDRMLSMSNMKHDAIVAQGIRILERIPIPEGKPRDHHNSSVN